MEVNVTGSFSSKCKVEKRRKFETPEIAFEERVVYDAPSRLD